MRAHAARGTEHFVTPRIVDGAAKNLPAALKADRDTEEWILMRKVGRAVQRIDDPPSFHAFRPFRWPVRTRLLRKDGMMRISFTNPANDERLGLPVRRRDQVRV